MLRMVSGLPKAVPVLLRNPASAFLYGRIAGWVVGVSILVRLLPITTLLKVVTPGTMRPPPVDLRRVQHDLAWRVDRLLGLNVFCFAPVCWKRSVVLYRFLALNGISTTVAFGVRKDGGGSVEGHAWLERDGQPILENAKPDYCVAFSYPL